MRRKDFTTIATFEHTGTLSAGNKYDDYIKLESDQVAEITAIEIFSPVDEGTYEDLLRVVPYIDGKYLEDYIALAGQYDLCFTPPMANVVRWFYEFGEPATRDPRRNTTLKAVEKVGIRAEAGASNVDADFTIRLWGVLYEEEESVIDVFGETIYGIDTPVAEDIRGTSLVFTKPQVDVSLKNFDKLVGGVNQDSPKVMPFARFGKNTSATTPNTFYEYRSDNGNVDYDWENFYWDLDEDKAVIITRAGVRSVSNLKYMAFKIDGDYFPPDKMRVDVDLNYYHFGLADQIGYTTANWFGIPKLRYPIMIHDEIGRFGIIDNGTAVSADTCYAALAGWEISEM